MQRRTGLPWNARPGAMPWRSPGGPTFRFGCRWCQRNFAMVELRNKHEEEVHIAKYLSRKSGVE